MKIAVGNDHAGYDDPPPHYKPEIVAHLEGRGHEVVNCGSDGPESVDYPDYAQRVCEAVLRGEAEVGLLLCGTGIGMSIAANRNAGIRAATCTSVKMADLSREHNDANVLCIGRRILTLKECIEIVDAWLERPFSDSQRHRRRVAKMG